MDTVCSRLGANIFKKKLKPINITPLVSATGDSIPGSRRLVPNVLRTSHQLKQDFDNSYIFIKLYYKKIVIEKKKSC